MGVGLAVEKKEIRNVSGSRGTKTQTNRDDIAIHLRHSHDGRETLFYFLAIYSRNCLIRMHVLICIANLSHIVARGN